MENALLYYSAAYMHPTESNFGILKGFDRLPIEEKIYTLITGGGYLLATQHWELGNWDSSLVHRIIAVIECCPLLGGLCALIEAVASWMIVTRSDSLSNALITESKEYFAQLSQAKTDLELCNDACQLFDKAPTSQRAQYIANRIQAPQLKQAALLVFSKAFDKSAIYYNTNELVTHMKLLIAVLNPTILPIEAPLRDLCHHLLMDIVTVCRQILISQFASWENVSYDVIDLDSAATYVYLFDQIPNTYWNESIGYSNSLSINPREDYLSYNYIVQIVTQIFPDREYK